VSQKTIRVPDIGGAEGAEVVELLVAVGDHIELEQSLIVLESDKASMEIPASSAGVVLEVKVAMGDQLSEGDAVVVISVAADGDDANASAAEGIHAEDAAEGVAEDVIAAPEAADAASAQSSNGAIAAAKGAPVGGEAKLITVEIPDIGTDGDVELVEISVTVGQHVEEGESLVVLESDKASMEVPAPVAGKVVKLLVDAGQSVSQGVPLLELEATVVGDDVASDAVANGQAQTAVVAAPAIQPQATAQSAASSSPLQVASKDAAVTTSDIAGIYAGPAVRKLAREFGIPLGDVSGSGPRGRLVKDDLHAFVKAALKKGSATAAVSGAGIAPIPDVDFSQFGEIDAQPRSRLDKLTASNMTRAWLNVPHVTQFDDADITDLEAFRASLKAEAEKRQTKITPMPFLLKACAVALNANPKLKSSLADAGETLVYKQYCHIGMAVDTPNGLVVPVIRDVDKKSIWELSEEVIELAGLARDKKLKPAQMQGGVFSISSLGGIGGRGFTPIVNAPEVAILGVSKASMQPVWDGSAFVPRNMLPLALSYDHRVINGGDAGRFLTELVGLLSDIRRLVM
jgi:pyruvate dehydrogenase E2 component (dihydrolipoamide acetyltransferase)